MGFIPPLGAQRFLGFIPPLRRKGLWDFGGIFQDFFIWDFLGGEMGRNFGILIKNLGFLGFGHPKFWDFWGQNLKLWDFRDFWDLGPQNFEIFRIGTPKFGDFWDWDPLNFGIFRFFMIGTLPTLKISIFRDSGPPKFQDFGVFWDHNPPNFGIFSIRTPQTSGFS